jgi:hypothetical protein
LTFSNWVNYNPRKQPKESFLSYWTALCGMMAVDKKVCHRKFLPEKQKGQLTTIPCRVARWFVFKPKIPIWVNFRGPWNEKCCYIL